MPISLPTEPQRGDAGVLSNARALAGLPRIAERLLPLRQAHELYERTRQFPSGSALESLLLEMDIDLHIDAADVERIPKRGPVVVVGNHPYGVLDGAVLAVLLARVRPDVKILNGLIMVDLRETNRSMLERYTGKSEATGFRRQHGLA